MRYTVYSLFIVIISFNSYSQFSVECIIELEDKDNLINFIKVYNKDVGFIDEVKEGEKFVIESKTPKATFIFIANEYSVIEK